MGFYGVTRIQYIQTPSGGGNIKVAVNYLPGTHLGALPNITQNLAGTVIDPTTVLIGELITDGYITILKPRLKEHTINIYSTQHNNHFTLQTPNNHMATYECKRLCSDFGVDTWQGVSLQVALIKSLDVLKKYMDSFVGKTYTDSTGTAHAFINTTTTNWKIWKFILNDDYGVIRMNTNTVLYPNDRTNTKYQSIPSPPAAGGPVNPNDANINNFIIGKEIPVEGGSIRVWDNATIQLNHGTTNYSRLGVAVIQECWLRLPCFSIFNQISIFKGNGDICQELYTLTKFGGIYQDNNDHYNGGPRPGGYNPEILNSNTLPYLKNDEIYKPVNYIKPPVPVGAGDEPVMAANNYYGAGARKINSDLTDGSFTPTGGVVNKLSITDPKYIPYDRFGNAPRAFLSGDRLSGLRYIMLSFLGLKYFIRRIYDNNSLENPNDLTRNQKLCNNINILSFGGYNYRLLNSIMSKINFNFINKIYRGKTETRNNQIYNILASLYQANVGALAALQPSTQIRLLTNYAGINTNVVGVAGGGKKSKTLKKKLGKKIIKKRTKKISKKYKKTIKKIKNIKKNPKKSQKIFKTYKNKK
jgi:hypothetical protein